MLAHFAKVRMKSLSLGLNNYCLSVLESAGAAVEDAYIGIATWFGRAVLVWVTGGALRACSVYHDILIPSL